MGHGEIQAESENPISLRRLIRNFLIELGVYGVLVVGYFLIALRLLGEPLERLFDENLTLYAFASLGLIVAQGFLLDLIVTFILDLTGLDRLE